LHKLVDRCEMAPANAWVTALLLRKRNAGPF